MSEFIEVHWTSGSIDEARKISRYLVQERLVACAQIIPWIESISMWNGQLETNQESKIVMKSRAEHLDAIKKVIRENCKYQVPEIICHVIDDVNTEYLEWLRASTLVGSAV